MVRAAIVLMLSLVLWGCGGAMHARVPPRAQHHGGYPGASYATATADRDGDGVLESRDAAPMAPPAEVSRNEMAAPAPEPAPPPPPPPPGGDKGEKKKAPDASEQPHDTAMLIYTARVTMAVYQVDQGLTAVERIARDMGGYLAVKRDREITIRVPRARFEPALAAIDKVGDVLHRDIQAQDVTDEYVDLEIRIKNARAMQTRLKQLLERANVKEALEIEKEMRRVTEELELLEGKIKLLKDKIAYSTITVAFEPRGSSIQATKIRLPFPWLSQLGLPNLLQLNESK
ncbi:MAG: DUF4349 domain-containing protein [Labilithrix sp.]|nr:DUF4349 domain-containing protein [Labilithrix sp.]